MLKKEIRTMKSSVPLYIRLYEHLREYIESEDARQIGKLPKELELCRIFKVSRNTVSQALSMLEEEQLICRIKHRGTFLASALNEFDPQNIRRTIGAVFPSEPAWEETIGAIRSGCRKLGYEFRLYTYRWDDPEEEINVISKAEKFCGGLILYPGGTGKSLEYIRKKKQFVSAGSVRSLHHRHEVQSCHNGSFPGSIFACTNADQKKMPEICHSGKRTEKFFDPAASFRLYSGFGGSSILLRIDSYL